MSPAEKRREERVLLARARLDAGNRRLAKIKESRQQRQAKHASTIESAGNLAVLMRQMAEQLEHDARKCWGDAKTLREGADVLAGLEPEPAPESIRERIEANAARALDAIDAEVKRLEGA